ncbi:hypothetical protein HED60_23375 [Planctomycetales bacterium ZRK34]|nr:hypothetical protein HED60_23375 [Planctomycetales bacterium ZRK34]
MFSPNIGGRMISTRDPQTMTERERRDEVATILAAGLLRCVRASRSQPDDSDETSSPGPRNGLDVPSKTRLSVAQRPTG